MSDNPKISVIVPVYNAEKYLRRCIDSILNQTFTDFEVLLINDGSTDSSGVICDEYAKQDSRVRVFHKENGGVSSARQLGVDKAVGIYSIHIDSDDWVELNMLDSLYGEVMKNEFDVLIFDLYRETNNSTTYVKYHICSTSKESVLEDLLMRRNGGSCCNKLVRHSLYKNYNITFPSLGFGEDWYVNVKQVLYSQNIGYFNKAFYHYRYNPSSIMNNLSKYDFDKRFSIIKRVVSEIEKSKQVTLDLEKCLVTHILSLKVMCIHNRVYTKKELLLNNSKYNKYILHSMLPFKQKILFLLYFFIPEVLFYYIYSKRLKIRELIGK